MIVTTLADWLITAGIVIVATAVAPGSESGGPAWQGVTAVGIGAANVAVRPLVGSLPFPVPMIVLAILYLILNGVLLKLATTFVPGFGFAGPGGLVVAAGLIALGTTALFALAGRLRQARKV